VKEVKVEGNVFVSKDEIIQTSELLGKLFTIINKKETERKLSSIKMLRVIEFKQESFDSIKIHVQEKEIIMLGHIRNKIGHIDSENNFIVGLKDYVGVNFPIFNSDSIQNIEFGVEILNLLVDEGLFAVKEISEITYNETIGITVFASDNVKIYFGKNELKVKIENLKKILGGGKKGTEKPCFIDISNIRKGIVNYKCKPQKVL
jgi:cell division septal protein FtsQ